MATDRGAEVVRRDGKAFARFQWESWSPHGWFDDAVFNAVAESLKNPDWPNMTLHSYRVRWGEAEPDSLRRVGETTKVHISVATLVIQGGSRPLHRPPASPSVKWEF
jgi:hypothetical protein